MVNKLTFFAGLILVVVILGIAIYNSSKTTSLNKISSNKLQITTSIYPLYFFTTQLVGDKADVKNIIPAGAEPHEYEPSARDIARLETSDLIILNGGPIEPWANSVEKDIENKSKIIITGKTLMSLKMEDEGATIQDPHVWLSANLAITIANNITMTLIKADPKNESYYTNNYAVLSEKLDNLDKKYQKGLSECTSREIVTSHSAFGYIAKTYNLHQLSISGLSPDAEPSLKQLTKITEHVKKNNIKYIFFESLISPKLSQTLAQETGAKTLVLDPIEGVSQQDMQNGKNYFTIMEDNLSNLETALQCK